MLTPPADLEYLNPWKKINHLPPIKKLFRPSRNYNFTFNYEECED